MTQHTTTREMFTGTPNQVFDFVTTDNKHLTWKIFDVLDFIRDNPHEIGVIEPQDVKEIFESEGTIFDIDKTYAMTTNLQRPILIVTLPEGSHIIIDGSHRLYRAYIEGKSLYAVMLNAVDSEMLRSK